MLLSEYEQVSSRENSTLSDGDAELLQSKQVFWVFLSD